MEAKPTDEPLKLKRAHRSANRVPVNPPTRQMHYSLSASCSELWHLSMLLGGRDVFDLECFDPF